MKTSIKKEESELMFKDPSNWKWIFYYNPNDSRVFVPKMNPFFGWTLNYGHKKAWIGLVLIISFVVLLVRFL